MSAMKNSTYIKTAGLISLISLTLVGPGLAEPLAYSADRWPARWSSIIRQNQSNDYQQVNAYRDGQSQVARQENPWAHDSSVLFSVPTGHRPWGEPPRKTYRQRTRSSSYREQRRPAYRQNTLYNQTAYGAGIMPQAYQGRVYPYPYAVPGAAGLTPYGYGASPLLGSPLLAPPLMGNPYSAYPNGMRGMNWPFGAW